MVAAFIGIAIGGALWDALAADPWRFSRAFLPNKAHYFALGIASWGLVRALASARSAMPCVVWEASPARGAVMFYTAILAAVSALAFSRGEIGKLLPPLVWTMCLAVDLRPGATLSTHLGWMLRSRPLQWLGAISYSLYLVNEPLQKLAGLFVAWIAQGDSWYFTALWAPMALLPPIGIAALLRRWVERPALRWTGTRVQRLQSTGGGGPEVMRPDVGTRGLCIRSRAGYTRSQ